MFGFGRESRSRPNPEADRFEERLEPGALALSQYRQKAAFDARGTGGW